MGDNIPIGFNADGEYTGAYDPTYQLTDEEDEE